MDEVEEWKFFCQSSLLRLCLCLSSRAREIDSFPTMSFEILGFCLKLVSFLRRQLKKSIDFESTSKERLVIVVVSKHMFSFVKRRKNSLKLCQDEGFMVATIICIWHNLGNIFLG